MTRMKVNGSTLTVKNVPDEVLDALDEAADDSRSQLVRDILSEWYEEHDDTKPDQYYPADDQLAEIYAACWEVCNDDLIVSWRRHSSLLRQRTQEDEGGLRGAFMKLQERGFISRTPCWPGASQTESYRIKPPCADPDQWVHRTN